MHAEVEAPNDVAWQALALSVIAVVPFLYDYPLHPRWDALGKKILILARCLPPILTSCAGMTGTFWLYLRDGKKINEKFAPRSSTAE